MAEDDKTTRWDSLGREPVVRPDDSKGTSEAGGYVKRGLAFFMKGDLGPAIGEFGKTLESDPDDRTAKHHSLVADGFQSLRVDRPQHALSSFIAALEINPSSLPALFGKTVALDDLYDRSVNRCCDALVDLLTSRPEPLSALAAGWASFFQGEYEQVLKYLDLALQHRIMPPEAYHQKGKCFVQLHRRQEAIGYFDKAISLDANFVKAYNSKAAVFMDSGQDREAMECVEKALAVNPRSCRALIFKAQLFSFANEYEAAILAADQAILVNPKEDGGWLQKGTALIYSGRTTEGASCLRRAVEIRPSLRGVFPPEIARML